LDDLIRKVDQYLRHNEERESIAAAGKSFLNDNYSVTASIRELLALINLEAKVSKLDDTYYATGFNNLGRPTQSMDQYFSAMESRLNPNYAQSYLERGINYLNLDKLDKAVNCLESALDLDPFSGPILFYLGLALFRQDKLADSAKTLKRLLATEPFHAEGNYLFGEILTKQGKYEQGEYHKQKGAKLK
jgi:tetratricopeptide (TPR) repeat protein